MFAGMDDCPGLDSAETAAALGVSVPEGGVEQAAAVSAVTVRAANQPGTEVGPAPDELNKLMISLL